MTADSGDYEGGAGVASGVTLVPVMVWYSGGGIPYEWSAQAVNWARGNAIKVVNMSFGGYGISLLNKEALRNARAAGMSCVAASGNNNVTTPFYPAAYARHVLAVNAFMPNGNRWQDSDLPGGDDGTGLGSNYGSYLDLTAPGGRGILTTRRHFEGSGYYDLHDLDPDNCDDNDWVYPPFTPPEEVFTFGGTSAAAPFVSGCIAAVLSHNLILDGEDAQEVVRRTAVDHPQYGTGWDDRSGWGRPDLEAALEITAVVPYLPERATVVGGTEAWDGAGEFFLHDIPGVHCTNPCYFDRIRVTRTVSLQHTYTETPIAWARVEGTVGMRRLGDEEDWYYYDEDPGWAEVVSVTTTTITLRSYYYKAYRDEAHQYHIWDYPTGIQMSYTALGPTSASGVEEKTTSAGGFVVRPNPAASSVRLQFGGNAGAANRRVGVYSASGQLVRYLDVPRDGLDWNLRDERGQAVPNGVYFVRETGHGRGGRSKLLIVR